MQLNGVFLSILAASSILFLFACSCRKREELAPLMKGSSIDSVFPAVFGEYATETEAQS